MLQSMHSASGIAAQIQFDIIGYYMRP
jgi:hypothetical protein